MSTITIPQEQYDRLLAANDLLCQILDDQDGLLEVYWELYPILMEEAGFEQLENAAAIG
ncbi:MAG TPA: hypothetical protein VE957_10270 [Terriglobales bacterium]|nr:hypothetical protein [Terriglobales bacterium]